MKTFLHITLNNNDDWLRFDMPDDLFGQFNNYIHQYASRGLKVTPLNLYCHLTQELQDQIKITSIPAPSQLRGAEVAGVVVDELPMAGGEA